MAIPISREDVILLSASIDSFHSDLEQKVRSNPTLCQLRVRIQEVTRLVDDDMGECFVVGMCFDAVDYEAEDSDGRTPAEVLVQELGGSTAEAWVTSAGPIPLAPPYGWKRDTFVRKPNDTKSICDCLREYGLVIVQHAKTENSNNQQHNERDNTNGTVTDDNSLIYQEAKIQLKQHVDLLEQTVCEHYPHIELGKSAFGFEEYTHRGLGRFEVLFDPVSSLYQLLRERLEPQWIDSVCQYLQSDRASLRLNISCVYSRPGATDQDWHTDGGHYSHGGKVGEPSEHQPYAVCIFVPLIPLTAETGFTRFWPKSHLYPNLLGLARAADTLQATIDGVNMQCGDFLMYGYTTWHKGVRNSSSDVERPIVQFLYSCEWYKERKNYGTKSVFDTVPSVEMKLTTIAS